MRNKYKFRPIKGAYRGPGESHEVYVTHADGVKLREEVHVGSLKRETYGYRLLLAGTSLSVFLNTDVASSMTTLEETLTFRPHRP